MAKIMIMDLPKDQKISKEEMSKVLGGTCFRINKTDTPLIVSPWTG